MNEEGGLSILPFMKYPVSSVCVTSLLAVSFLGAGVNAEEKKPFTGTIVYEQSAAGGAGAKAFNGMAASKITVHIGEKAYRQDENGGINQGSVIIRDGSKDALRLNHKSKATERGRGTKLDDMEPKMKKFMAAHFDTPLKATDEVAEIAGFQTKKYQVLKSPFVRQGATAHIWVAEDLDIGRHRYDFHFKYNRIIAPLPQSIPVKKGTILKAVVVENGTTVTMVVTKVDRAVPAADLFVKPASYTGPDFPAPLKPMPAPTGPIPDVSQLEASFSNPLGMKFVLVKPGVFTMGSPKMVRGRKVNETEHQVTLTRPYYLATTEVTQAQWKTVMGSDSPSKFKGENLPVENVTWQQAMEFCKKLSEREKKTYRLPTEAEWEYAARAGDVSKAMDRKERKAWLSERAWMYDTAKYKTHPVGQLKANAWGLHDMLGNVAEYTLSGMGEYPKGKATDPQGMQNEIKVVRGGDWVSSGDWVRYASRTSREPNKGKSTIGFRVLCVPK